MKKGSSKARSGRLTRARGSKTVRRRKREGAPLPELTAQNRRELVEGALAIEDPEKRAEMLEALATVSADDDNPMWGAEGKRILGDAEPMPLGLTIYRCAHPGCDLNVWDGRAGPCCRSHTEQHGNRLPPFSIRDLNQIVRLVGYGLTEPQIAAVMHISPRTLRRRKREDPNLVAAIDMGKATAMKKVGQALYTKAVQGDLQAIRWWDITRSGIFPKRGSEVDYDRIIRAVFTVLETLAAEQSAELQLPDACGVAGKTRAKLSAT